MLEIRLTLESFYALWLCEILSQSFNSLSPEFLNCETELSVSHVKGSARRTQLNNVCKISFINSKGP